MKLKLVAAIQKSSGTQDSMDDQTPIKYGVCPVCNGTKVNVGTGQQCRNCGGQQMYGTPTGKVRLRKDGTPCTHEYTVTKISNCYYQYDCKYCDDTYKIDSSD